MPVAAEAMAPGAAKIKADDVAAEFRKEVQVGVAALKGGVRPKLVGFLSNRDPAARSYAEWTARAFERDSLRFELREVEEHALEEALEKANQDPEVHGIMIYYPVFGQRPSFHGSSMDDYLRDTVSIEKDVEGLCHYYRRCLYRNCRFVEGRPNAKCVVPCTPVACVKILEYLDVYDRALPLGDRMRAKTVSIVNRSEVLGRPLAAMLANDGATVYSIDIDSIHVYKRGMLEMPPEGTTPEDVIKASDIVVLGVPSEAYKLDVSWVREGAIVLNVATCKNIDEERLLTTRPGVRYVGQVGKVTVAMLERNLLRLYTNFVEERQVLQAGG